MRTYFRLAEAGKKRRGLLIGTLGAGFIAAFASTALGQQPGGPAPEQAKALQVVLESQLQVVTPEMRQRIMALSAQSKQELMKIIAGHTRRSVNVTMRQVMHEVMADYGSMTVGVLTENGEQAAESARRLAGHRLPRGGLLPYFKLDQVTDQTVSALVLFNDAVEGNALRLADAAEKRDFGAAAGLVGQITAGCVGCHQTFRDYPGLSPYVTKQ